MIITDNIKMADVILQNHHLLAVINRFGIQLGFGDKSVKEVCGDYQINSDFFLEIINAFNDPDFYPQHKLEKFPLKLIIDFLRKAHSFYLDQKIPEIASMIDNIVEASPSNQQKTMRMIQLFFGEYQQQLKEHIAREETVVYPYILKLEDYLQSKEKSKEAYDMLMIYQIENYADEHDNIEDKLKELKTIIIKYLPPQKDYLLCYKILGQLDHLEDDMNNHSEMENKVLVPRVQIMEQVLKEMEV
ncbi:MAG: hemerythrin domain-containing protein [Bacteroidales bacterium]|nr:hemerythrin domain-containing protein [Bacteroidales bacterium]